MWATSSDQIPKNAMDGLSLRRQMIGWILASAAAILLFFSGIAVRHYELPPYAWARELIMALSPTPDLHRYRGPQHAGRMSLFSEFKGGADVVMLGDSIIQYGEWAELFPNVQIINRGIAGDVSASVLQRVDEVIARKPRVVFLMVGINDLLLGIAPQAIAGNVRSIVERLGPDTIIQSTLPTSDNVAINEKVAALNVLLAKGAARFVDLRQRWRRMATFQPRTLGTAFI